MEAVDVTDLDIIDCDMCSNGYRAYLIARLPCDCYWLVCGMCAWRMLTQAQVAGFTLELTPI